MSGYSGNPYARPPAAYGSHSQPSTSAAPVAGPSYGGYNSYAAAGQVGGSYDYTAASGPTYDPAYAQQSSAYSPNAYVAPSGSTQSPVRKGKPTGRTTVLRKGGDLDPALSDELFEGAFRGGGKYASFVKAKIIREKHTNKGKGFGFVSYSDPEDFLKAWKDLNGKYIGTRPVTIKKATAGVASVNIGARKAREFDEKKPRKTGNVPYSKANAADQARGGPNNLTTGKSWIRR